MIKKTTNLTHSKSNILQTEKSSADDFYLSRTNETLMTYTLLAV